MAKKKSKKPNASYGRQKEKEENTFFHNSPSSPKPNGRNKRNKNSFIKTVSIILSLTFVITIYYLIWKYCGSEIVTATYVSGAFDFYVEMQKYFEDVLKVYIK